MTAHKGQWVDRWLTQFLGGDGTTGSPLRAIPIFQPKPQLFPPPPPRLYCEVELPFPGKPSTAVSTLGKRLITTSRFLPSVWQSNAASDKRHDSLVTVIPPWREYNTSKDIENDLKPIYAVFIYFPLSPKGQWRPQKTYLLVQDRICLPIECPTLGVSLFIHSSNSIY